MSDTDTAVCPYCPPIKLANFKEVDSYGFRLFDCGEHVFRYNYVGPLAASAAGSPATSELKESDPQLKEIPFTATHLNELRERASAPTDAALEMAMNTMAVDYGAAQEKLTKERDAYRAALEAIAPLGERKFSGIEASEIATSALAQYVDTRKE